MRVKAIRKKAAIVAKKGARKLKEAEKSGALEKWNKRLSLGLKVVEAAVLVTTVVKAARINGKRRTTARRRSTTRSRSR